MLNQQQNSFLEQKCLLKVKSCIKYLWVFDKAQLIVNVHLDVLWLGAADRRHNDDQPLLTLKLLHRAHLDVAMVTLLQNCLKLLHLEWY